MIFGESEDEIEVQADDFLEHEGIHGRNEGTNRPHQAQASPQPPSLLELGVSGARQRPPLEPLPFYRRARSLVVDCPVEDLALVIEKKRL